MSQNFQNSKNKIEIDLTKMKKLESSPSLCELNKMKNYNNIKKKNVIDEERAKLLKDIELEKKKFISNKPDDIVEHRKIDYKKDIIIEDPYLKNYPDLYETMQKHLIKNWRRDKWCNLPGSLFEKWEKICYEKINSQ